MLRRRCFFYATYNYLDWYLKKNGYPRSSRHNIAFHCQIPLFIDLVRVNMISSISLCWSCAPVATPVVAGLGLVLLALVLVVLYSRAHRGLKRTADLKITQVRGSSILRRYCLNSIGKHDQHSYLEKILWPGCTAAL